MTKMRGRQALLSYLETYAFGHIDRLETFLGCVAELLEKGMKTTRIGMSVLRYLPQALSHLDVIEADPDSSSALQRIVLCLVKVAAVPSAPPVRVRLVIDSFASLLNFALKSSTWRTAAHQVGSAHLFSSTAISKCRNIQILRISRFYVPSRAERKCSDKFFAKTISHY